MKQKTIKYTANSNNCRSTYAHSVDGGGGAGAQVVRQEGEAGEEAGRKAGGEPEREARGEAATTEAWAASIKFLRKSGHYYCGAIILQCIIRSNRKKQRKAA